MHGNTPAVTSSLPGFPNKSTISIFTLSGNDWSLSQTLTQPFFQVLPGQKDPGQRS